MYQADRRIISHRKRRVVLVWLGIVLLLLVGVGYVLMKFFITANTTIAAPPAPVINQVTGKDGKDKTFVESGFTISLPSDWVLASHQDSTFNVYTWHNTKGDAGIQQLQVYYDTIPSSLGVNRILPVQGNGGQVIPTTVSENCTGFTNGKLPGPSDTPSKWDGVNFLCDMGNYERDVVGTSSTDGINLVKLSSSSTGHHNLFFTYTDNNSTPNFEIFTNALTSFHLN
jgi:hypothetical protein